MIKISSSILSADFARLGEEVRLAQTAGADFIHIDVMDGHFVPNLTVGPLIVQAIRPYTTLPLEIHLMIKNPDLFLDDFAEVGADYLGIHIETCHNIRHTINHITKLGKRPTVILNPYTPLKTLNDILDIVDVVLIMSVNPGLSGQFFIPKIVNKIAILHKTITQRGLNVKIEVDGGINEHTIIACVEAGAQIFVVGSAFFKHPKGSTEIVKLLRHAAKQSNPNLLK